jgi:hypothetical protein
MMALAKTAEPRRLARKPRLFTHMGLHLRLTPFTRAICIFFGAPAFLTGGLYFERPRVVKRAHLGRVQSRDGLAVKQ